MAKTFIKQSIGLDALTRLGMDPFVGHPLNIEVLPAISEFMVTPGDVGRPPAELAREFPQVCLYMSSYKYVNYRGHCLHACTLAFQSCCMVFCTSRAFAAAAQQNTPSCTRAREPPLLSLIQLLPNLC